MIFRLFSLFLSARTMVGAAIPAVLLLCYLGYVLYSEHRPLTAPPRPMPPVLESP